MLKIVSQTPLKSFKLGFHSALKCTKFYTQVDQHVFKLSLKFEINNLETKFFQSFLLIKLLFYSYETNLNEDKFSHKNFVSIETSFRNQLNY